MIRPLFLSLLFGCEQIEPTGDPLKPVAVNAPVALDVEADVEEVEEEEAFTISSEELAAIADGTDVVEDAKLATATPSGSTEKATAPPPPPPAAPPPTATPPVPAPATGNGWPDQVGKAWPVRLVTTVPNASPPRAILGLPDGKEVVVNPGSMVPDLGLVVVAISPGSAELAKIAPAGDHATIESITLRAQY